MWLRKPGPERIESFLRAQAGLDFTYAAVGATKNLIQNVVAGSAGTSAGPVTGNNRIACEIVAGSAGTPAGPEPSCQPNLTGFVVDHTRVHLGQGDHVYARACDALRKWRQFHLGWVEAWPTCTPLERGQVIAVLAHLHGFWWLNGNTRRKQAHFLVENGPTPGVGK